MSTPDFDTTAFLAQLEVRARLFPARLCRLGDQEYVLGLAEIIAEDVGHLPEDWRQDIFRDLVNLRVKVNRMREAANYD